METIATFRVPTERQGQTGMGQGGHTAHAFVDAIDQPVTVALRSPIPLETDLAVIATDDRWLLIDPNRPEIIIFEGTRWEADFASTEPVSITAAEAARRAFPLTRADHPAPHCLSCGLNRPSLHVHAGPLGDGRWATPFRLPHWSRLDDAADLSLLWMAMDCACGWYINHSGNERRRSLTVQLATEVTGEILPETDYALVAWNGDSLPEWDGRKRGSSAALFTADGECVARSRSLWVSLKD